MRKRSQLSQISSGRKQAGGRKTEPKGNAEALVELTNRFKRYRAKRRPGARVPEDLREATVAALRRGVSPGELYRRCGVSSEQLRAWKAARKSTRRKRKRCGDAADVQVFSVVDSQAQKPVDKQWLENAMDEELFLQLGRWSVRVGRAESAQGGC